MMESPRVRHAVRAVVVDHDFNTLLVHLRFSKWAGWVLPGGGLLDGEEDAAGIRRELAEELGLTGVDLRGPIWERTVRFSDPVDYDAQAERIYFVQCAPFTPAPHLSWEQLRAEGVTDVRWWTQQELNECTEVLAPSRLAVLLRALMSEGLPSGVVDVGE
jgi:8-oxo-dGTP pyrophosphatase MutT (NUDIX family)